MINANHSKSSSNEANILFCLSKKKRWNRSLFTCGYFVPLFQRSIWIRIRRQTKKNADLKYFKKKRFQHTHTLFAMAVFHILKYSMNLSGSSLCHSATCIEVFHFQRKLRENHWKFIALSVKLFNIFWKMILCSIFFGFHIKLYVAKFKKMLQTIKRDLKVYYIYRIVQFTDLRLSLLIQMILLWE